MHVSTAFSNADKHQIDEKVYQPPVDVNAVISLIENFPDEIIERVSNKLTVNDILTYYNVILLLILF